MAKKFNIFGRRKKKFIKLNVKPLTKKEALDRAFYLPIPKTQSRTKTKRFIQKIKLKKGALSKQLEIPEKKDIPITLLNKIIKAKAGQTIKNPTKTGKRKIKVTRLLERKSIFAKTLKIEKEVRNNMVRKVVNVRGYLRKVPGTNRQVRVKPQRRKFPKK